MAAREGAAPKKPSQADVIRELIARERTVTVDGTHIRLRIPDVATATAVRQLAVDAQDTSDADAVAISLAMAGAAVAACVEGLDEEAGVRAVLVSGGELGDLASTVLKLCGLGGAMQRVGEGDTDLPT